MTYEVVRVDEGRLFLLLEVSELPDTRFSCRKRYNGANASLRGGGGGADGLDGAKVGGGGGGGAFLGGEA